MNIIKYASLLVAVASLAYYGWMLSYLGFRKDFSLIWPCAFIGFAGLAGLALYVERTDSILCRRVLSCILLIILALFLLLVFLEGKIIKNAQKKPESNADYLIVLGAQVKGTKVSMALQNRLDAAYSYLLENEDTMVIVSGGQGTGEDVSEAQAMKEYLIKKGINGQRIIEENKSTNTIENIQYSEKFLNGSQHIIIVTNSFHLYRGVSIAKKQLKSCKVEGLGAKTGNGLVFNYYIREAAGVLKDSLAGNM